MILVAGYFYFKQMQNHLYRMEEFSLIEYARHFKMNLPLDEFSKDYSYKLIYETKHIDIKNFSITHNKFTKYLPVKHASTYLKVTKSKKTYMENSWMLQKKIMSTQFGLLLLFAFISYLLAKSALKPLQESISTLDRFTKDLIHDLNTPVTSIKLNLKLLEKETAIQNQNALHRLNKSVQNITQLHESLTLLLQEETFQMQMLNLGKIIEDIVNTQKQIYPHILFSIECQNLHIKLNQYAIEQILQNIISNACKYSHENAYVKIYYRDKKLYIEDNGKGIREPEKIFTRTYSDENSSGIGLDIVKRLAQSMNILIQVQTKEQGTLFILTMP